MKGLINPSVVVRSFGISIGIIGLFMLTSVFFALYYQENTAIDFLISAGICIGMGIFLSILTRKSRKDEIGDRDAFMIVGFTWVMAGFAGALPYMISGSIPGLTDAYFESISGFTTTGASILNDIEELPKSILFWRSLTHWLGGMGIIVLVIAVLPVLGIGGMKLFVAEAPGLNTTKIHPRIRQTALKFWGIYLGMTIMLIILLMAGDMNFFESICHAMGTVSTGGFSPKNNSIADYSAYSQVIITVFMFFSGTNFIIHWFLINGKLGKVFKNEEWFAFIALIVVVSAIVSLNLYYLKIYPGLTESFRHGFFQCVSIVTTTGFATADYVVWPQTTWFFIFLMFFSGGMIGSTSGGIKFSRHFILIKNLRAEIRRVVHPRLISSLTLNNIPVPDSVIRNSLIFFVVYIFMFCIGSLSMSLFIEEPIEAFGVTVSCMAGVGPAFGKYGPIGNYSSIMSGGKWVLSFIMILGRIEIFPILLIFTKSFWKI